MRRFDLMLFDLDGTLIETAPEITDALNDTLRRFNLPPSNQAQVERWIGHGTQELLVQALAQQGGTTVSVVRAASSLQLAREEFERCYIQRCGTRSRLYPHVIETLHLLRKQGIKLAVVTNKESRYTQRVLAAHGLLPMLDRVISGDSLPQRKPDPAGVVDCLDHFGVHRDRALFIGDSSIDVATARAAAVPVWLVPYGYNMGQPILASEPDSLISDFSCLL
jgi:phosphoglycolate phosphatase